jgi:hypothetical protein
MGADPEDRPDPFPNIGDRTFDVWTAMKVFGSDDANVAFDIFWDKLKEMSPDLYGGTTAHQREDYQTVGRHAASLATLYQELACSYGDLVRIVRQELSVPSTPAG